MIAGRIACELSSADELLLTEMMFNGLFNDLEPAQAASILSCFVCDERSNEMPKLTGELSGPLRTMQDMAKRIASVSKECKIEIDEELYVGKFKPYMMDIVYEWCKGATFMQLCKMTDIFEGKYLQGRGTSILGEVRNVEIPGPTQQLLCSKYHDFLAIFALAHSKINQIA